MNISVKHLRAFVEVYNWRKISTAAERLFVTQSAISLLIKHFEKEIGVTLFDRTTRSLQPTEAAHDVIQIAERVLRDLDTLGTDFHDLRALRKGLVHIAATPAVAAHIMPSIIMRFETEYPGVRVILDDCAPDKLLSLVAADHCDLAVGTPNQLSADIEPEILAHDYLSVICRKDVPLAKKRTALWTDLLQQRIITVKQGSGIRRLIDQTLSELQLDIRPTYEVTLLNTALGMTSKGLGISILPSYFLDYANDPDLVALKLTKPSVERNILLLKKRSRTLSPAAEKFRAHLHQEFERNRQDRGSGSSNSLDLGMGGPNTDQ